MIEIDGSVGEGGGQILRSSLALSLVTGRAISIRRIRSGRPKPGLQQQHLTALQAAAQVGGAEVTGDHLGAQDVTFRPSGRYPGAYHFAVGTAGSATLVLQTVLPALVTANGPSRLTLEGGTHNPWAPPFEFLEHTFLPVLRRMGARVAVQLARPGFHPAGGGRIDVEVAPGDAWKPVRIPERGTIRSRRGRVLLSRLPRGIADREIHTLLDRLGWPETAFEIVEVDATGPGNVVILEIECEHITEVVTAFGRRKVPAEAVAASAAEEAERYLAANVPVGEHLADQILLPLALAGGGSFRTLEPTAHARTNAEVIETFLPIRVDFQEESDNAWLVEVRRADGPARKREEHRPNRHTSAPYRIWGEGIEPQSIQQMDNACRLPISVRGALMPDAHLGYGLPIGGVLATRNAVIPYAVGVDIACRMKMTVLDLPPSALDEEQERLEKALVGETRFGVGSTFRRRRSHRVMDDDWSFSPATSRCKDKAWSQLGTSGSGNHFVEYGVLEVQQDGWDLAPGEYLALLSHSGSRGTGAQVADHYSRLARRMQQGLPKELHHLAWLDLDTQEGQEYWQAMELMGRYAAANHELIHRHVAEALEVGVLADVENHHNFAWRETHDGQEVIVHRKGATPAEEGVLGIIPGSMATPAYLVRGRGNEASLRSASHGAGRRMSRKEAKRRFSRRDLDAFLAEKGVRLISAGLDEVPMAYKDIEEVMAAQQDLVERIARFLPKIVKMAPAGERPED